MDEKRLRLKILSLLLQYPDDDLRGLLGTIGEAAGELAEEEPKAIFHGFVTHLGETPMMRLQEEYTSLFDLNPSTCLNLTYHKWGNEKKRGKALAHLSSLYRQVGYEPITNELPDYLPMVLEFLSVAPEDVCFFVLKEFENEIQSLASRLREMGSPYAGLLGLMK